MPVKNVYNKILNVYFIKTNYSSVTLLVWGSIYFSSEQVETGKFSIMFKFTHFMPLVSFYTSWKHQNTFGSTEFFCSGHRYLLFGFVWSRFPNHCCDAEEYIIHYSVWDIHSFFQFEETSQISSNSKLLKITLMNIKQNIQNQLFADVLLKNFVIFTLNTCIFLWTLQNF